MGLKGWKDEAFSDPRQIGRPRCEIRARARRLPTSSHSRAGDSCDDAPQTLECEVVYAEVKYSGISEAGSLFFQVRRRSDHGQIRPSPSYDALLLERCAVTTVTDLASFLNMKSSFHSHTVNRRLPLGYDVLF